MEPSFRANCPIQSRENTLNRNQAELETVYKPYGRNLNIISNPLADNNRPNDPPMSIENMADGGIQYPIKYNLYKDTKSFQAKQIDCTNNTHTSCDTESAYQELS